MKEKRYHLALIKGTGRVKCWGNNHRSTTVILQARTNVDLLSPSIWRYLRVCITTKRKLNENKAAILHSINTAYKTNFTTLIID